MSRIEKRLIAVALVFVAVYLGAAAATIHNRMAAGPEQARLESAEPLREERHLMMAELFLPMLILLTVTISFVLVKKKREKLAKQLDRADDEDWETDAEDPAASSAKYPHSK